MTYEAIILAGGFGTRLREAVPDLPKPMAPIAGRPFLAWQLDYLMAAGVTRVILSVGYKAETISDYFGDVYNGCAIHYVKEDEPLGTGGAIRLALTSATQERVFVCNGDTLCSANFAALRARSGAQKNAVSVLVKHVENAGRYGAIRFDAATQLITHFGEKSSSDAGFINAGIYDLPRHLFKDVEHVAPFSFESAVLQALVGTALYAEAAGEFFIDIGIKEDYLKGQTAIPAFVAGTALR
jgi:D-glycero-alpha-D-manno-heptose 1-phosphate guanylyltransferase